MSIPIFLKSMKTEGKVSRGRNNQESVLSKWVYKMYILNTICEDIETFCDISLDTIDHYVDTREARIKRNNGDINLLNG